MIFRTLKKIRTAAAFAVCFGIMLSPQMNYSVKATSTVADLEDKKQQLLDRNDQIDSEIASLDGSIADSEKMQDLYWEKLQTQKEIVDSYNNLIYYKNQEIADKQTEIEIKEQQIAAAEEEIAQKQEEIKALQAQNEKNLEQFGEILHAMYITGGIDIFSVLAEAADFYDILVRTKLMLNISRQNAQFVDGLKQSMENVRDMIARLEQDVEDLDRQRERLLAEKQELEQTKAQLEEMRSEAQSLSDSFNADYLYYAGLIDDYESRQQQLEAEKKINAEEAAAYEKQIQDEIKKAQQGSTQVYEDGEWMYPLDRKYTMITTYYGWDYEMDGRWHNGVDISGGGIYGADIYASKGGTVITAKNDYIDGYSYGKYIVIDHGSGYSTLYGHCSALYVSVGQQVSQGEIIGAVGSTGQSTGPHLHFEVRIDGTAYDPFGYIPAL